MEEIQDAVARKWGHKPEIVAIVEDEFMIGRIGSEKESRTWDPESRVGVILDSLETARQHLYFLGREVPNTTQVTSKAYRQVEIALQTVGRDLTREVSLPSLRMAGRNTRHLVKALEDYLKEIQKDSERELGKAWGKGGKYDPVADTGVWHGADVLRYSKSGADVVLHYDGAGYDYFSYGSTLSQSRRRVRNIAKKYGYMTEDINSWSMGFYPE